MAKPILYFMLFAQLLFIPALVFSEDIFSSIGYYDNEENEFDEVFKHALQKLQDGFSEQALGEIQVLADSGFVPAMTSLIAIYGEGVDTYGIKKDVEKSKYLLFKYADTGNDVAQMLVGLAYEEGLWGLLQDSMKSFKWVSKSAQKGNIAACDKLARFFLIGYGTEIDTLAALEYFRKASIKGNIESQYYLSWLLIQENSKYKNEKDAIIYLKLAANNNHDMAQTLLGHAYRFGIGVIEDPVLAHMWYNLAASNGNTVAREERNKIELTRSELEEAHRMAREWKPSE